LLSQKYTVAKMYISSIPLESKTTANTTKLHTTSMTRKAMRIPFQLRCSGLFPTNSYKQTEL